MSQPPISRGFRARVPPGQHLVTDFPVLSAGPPPLVESAAGALRDLGHDPKLIKTERFGSTGR